MHQRNELSNILFDPSIILDPISGTINYRQHTARNTDKKHKRILWQPKSCGIHPYDPNTRRFIVPSGVVGLFVVIDVFLQF